MTGGSSWFVMEKLTPTQKNEIKELLPKVKDENTLGNIFSTIEHDIMLDKETFNPNSLSPGQLVGELKKLRDHYRRALDLLISIDENEGGQEIKIIDQHHYLKNREHAMLIKRQKSHCFGNSGVEIITRELIDAISDRINEITVTPGRNNQSRYALLINDLANIFDHESFPYKPSSSETSPFYSLICYVFSNILCNEISNPTRHIESAFIFREQNTKK